MEVTLNARAVGDQAYTHKHHELKTLIKTFGEFLSDFWLKIHDCGNLPKESPDEKFEGVAVALDDMFKKSVVHNDGMKLALKNIKKSL